jgi:hypothetical protein
MMLYDKKCSKLTLASIFVTFESFNSYKKQNEPKKSLLTLVWICELRLDPRFVFPFLRTFSKEILPCMASQCFWKCM